jgi:ribonuclease HI
MRLDVFRCIGGSARAQPRAWAHLQTDGSFRHSTRLSRVAMILRTETDSITYRNMERIDDAQDSTETEWASVHHGLLFSLEKNERCVHIENDNMSVIQGLMMSNRDLKHDYAKYYRNQILMNAAQSYWAAVRWIPREMNQADSLFPRKRLR